MSTQDLLSFLPLLAVFGFFYFFVIRPQNKQQKQIQSMRKNLKKGDKIVTIGGFLGRIVAFKDETITIELRPDNVKVQITRAAVADVLNRDDAKTEQPAELPEDKETK
ncbi:MAG: preprotein translocase subunit YajC [Eubacteriaceae bacterium]|nr:preprotein translocase subunit YajC [Eubacteriaceae bacterium]